MVKIELFFCFKNDIFIFYIFQIRYKIDFQNWIIVTQSENEVLYLLLNG